MSGGMFSATWVVHVVCACIYLTMAVRVVARRPQAGLNRACAVLILSFCLWSATLAVCHHPRTSATTAEIFYDIGSFAWGSFASLAVLFVAIFWRSSLVRSPWLWIVLVIPPAIVIHAQWSGQLASAYPVLPWGHGYVWRDSAQTTFFLVYYTVYMLGGFAVLLAASFARGMPIRRRQARIILLSALVPLLAGSLTDVYLPRAGFYVFPNMAPDFTVAWVVGLVYAIVKYRMLELTPSVAADRVVETMSDALFLVQPEGRIAWPNHAALELLGYSTEEFRDMTMADLLEDPLDRARLFRSGRHDVSVRCKDGGHLDVSLSMAEIRGGLGELAGWVCVATDVTSRNLTEAELRRARDTLEKRVVERTEELQQLNVRLATEVAERKRSEDHYRLLIESMQEGLWVLDPDDSTTLANSRLGAILGYTPAELVGRRLIDFIGDGSVSVCLDTLRSAHAGLAGQGDWQLKGKDGRKPNTIVQVSPLCGQAGAYLGSVLTVMDVTEREAMRAQLTRAERLASMGLLAAGVGHEINNPLTFVIGNLEEIIRLTRDLIPQPRDAEGASVADMAREALAGTFRVREIVRELRRFSRAETHDVAPIDVHDAVDDAVKLAHHQIRFRAQLVRDFDREIPPALANRTGLSQVILNLLVNAAQAIPEGHPDDNQIRVQTWRDGDGVSIRVSDTGMGIRPEHLEKIFDPFFSTKPASEGQGLGLAICHEIIAAAGGRISVKSQLGRGTEFLIHLRRAHVSEPIASPPPARLPSAHPGLRPEPPPPSPPASSPLGPTASPSAPSPPRVLLIDDEDLVRRVLTRHLERQFRVVDLPSAEKAQDLLTEDADFDLIFCDMMMPGMSGMSLADWIGARFPTLAPRIIFMTGGAFTTQAEAYLVNAVNPVLEKPFQAAQVLRVARETLERQAAMAPSASGGALSGGSGPHPR